MKSTNHAACLILALILLATALVPGTSRGEGGSSVASPFKKIGDFFHDTSPELQDYNINWQSVRPLESQAFLPEMRCDLTKKYFDISTRDGFKIGSSSSKDSFPFLEEGIDYAPKGVMPWPGLLGFWQDWNDGVYVEIGRIKEVDLDQKVHDFMVIRLFSMCTDELLTESSTQVQNSSLNQPLTALTRSYGLKVSAEMLEFKVNKFTANPKTDELEIELRYVDSFTKEPRRSVLRIYRFL